jgi:antitoxin HicB
MFVHDYRVEIEPIPQAEGGGWLARVPDLPGCMSDSDDYDGIEATIGDAIETWIAAARRMGREVPQPADPVKWRA